MRGDKSSCSKFQLKLPDFHGNFHVFVPALPFVLTPLQFPHSCWTRAQPEATQLLAAPSEGFKFGKKNQVKTRKTETKMSERLN